MSEWLANLAPHWWWVGAGALLGILEILLPGIFLIWIAVAAWITAVIVAVAPLALVWQLVIFVVLAFVTVFAGRQYYARNPVESGRLSRQSECARHQPGDDNRSA